MIPLGVLASARHAPSGGGGASLTLTSWLSKWEAVSPVTRTIDIGTASATRTVVVLLMVARDAVRTITDCTINGSAVTVDLNHLVRGGVYVARAVVPTGTTATLAVTLNSGGAAVAHAVYTAPTALTVTSTATTVSDGVSTTMATSLTAPGDVFVAGATTSNYPQIGVTIDAVTADVSSADLYGGDGTPTGTPHAITATLVSPGTSGWSRLAAVGYTTA